ncbi:2497_t:CDS:2, partial [Racocetra persica]
KYRVKVLNYLCKEKVYKPGAFGKEVEKLYAISTDYTNTESNEKKVLEHTTCSNGFAAAVIHAYNYHKHL